MCAVRSVMGAEIRLGSICRVGYWPSSAERVGDRLRRVWYAGFPCRPGAARSAGARRDDLTGLDDRRRVVSRVSRGGPTNAFLSSPQIEREVSGLIRGDGLARRSGPPAFTIHIEMLSDGAFYFFGKAGRRQARPRQVDAWRACCRAASTRPWPPKDDASRLCGALIHFHSYPILSRLAKSPRDRRAATLISRSRLVMVPFGEAAAEGAALTRPSCA